MFPYIEFLFFDWNTVALGKLSHMVWNTDMSHALDFSPSFSRRDHKSLQKPGIFIAFYQHHDNNDSIIKQIFNHLFALTAHCDMSWKYFLKISKLESPFRISKLLKYRDCFRLNLKHNLYNPYHESIGITSTTTKRQSATFCGLAKCHLSSAWIKKKNYLIISWSEYYESVDKQDIVLYYR